MPEEIRFESAGELLDFLREHVDDVELVEITASQFAVINGKKVKGVGAVLHLCSGIRRVIGLGEAERLLKEGIFERLRIPVRRQDG